MEGAYTEETYGGTLSSQNERNVPERREKSYSEKKKKLKIEKREILPAFFHWTLN